jgi:hypothetical protein
VGGAGGVRVRMPAGGAGVDGGVAGVRVSAADCLWSGAWAGAGAVVTCGRLCSGISERRRRTGSVVAKAWTAALTRCRGGAGAEVGVPGAPVGFVGAGVHHPQGPVGAAQFGVVVDVEGALAEVGVAIHGVVVVVAADVVGDPALLRHDAGGVGGLVVQGPGSAVDEGPGEGGDDLGRGGFGEAGRPDRDAERALVVGELPSAIAGSGQPRGVDVHAGADVEDAVGGGGFAPAGGGGEGVVDGGGVAGPGHVGGADQQRLVRVRGVRVRGGHRGLLQEAGLRAGGTACGSRGVLALGPMRVTLLGWGRIGR